LFVFPQGAERTKLLNKRASAVPPEPEWTHGRMAQIRGIYIRDVKGIALVWVENYYLPAS
jgi:hypothetical protein